MKRFKLKSEENVLQKKGILCTIRKRFIKKRFKTTTISISKKPFLLITMECKITKKPHFSLLAPAPACGNL